MKRAKRITLINRLRSLSGLPNRSKIFLQRGEILEMVNYISDLQKTIQEIEDRLDNKRLIEDIKNGK